MNLEALSVKNIERMAAIGLTTEQIRLCLGLSRVQLIGCLGSPEALCEAIERGRAHGYAIITLALYKSAAGGSVGALDFALEGLPAQGRA